MSQCNSGEIALSIVNSTREMITIVERKFVDDWQLSPLAYTLLIRTATAGGDGPVEPEDTLPTCTSEDVRSAIDDLMANGYLELLSGGDHRLVYSAI